MSVPNSVLMSDELTRDQKTDLYILMSLKTKSEKQQWIDSVDMDQFYYGLSLLQVAAYIEMESQEGNDYADAVNLIEYIKSLN